MSDVPAPPPADLPNQVPPPHPYDASTQPDGPVPGKTLGIVAFVLSFFVQLVSLILGIVALVQSRKAGHKNGFALAAIIISVVLGALALVGIILFVVLAGAGFNAALACQDMGYVGTVEVAGEIIDCATLAPGAGF